MRRAVKRALLATGWHSLVRKVTDRRDFILTFHRITADSSVDEFDSCPRHSEGYFQHLLKHLQAQYEITALRDLVRSTGSNSRPRVALTFDDGWRDNYDIAFPILQRFEAPATIFVTTSKIGSCEPFWQQKLGSAFRAAIGSHCKTSDEVIRRLTGLPPDLRLTESTYRLAVQQLKEMHPSERASRLELLEPFQNSKGRVFLSESEIREMSDEGISFGSHTVTHPLLDQLDTEIVDYELSESKRRLEEITDKECDSIAYPNGNYSSDVVSAAIRQGYHMGCSVKCRRVAPHDDRMQLPRIELPWSVHAGSMPGFNYLDTAWATR